MSASPGPGTPLFRVDADASADDLLKVLFGWGLVGLILIPWALPFNLLLMGSPFVAWKQAYALGTMLFALLFTLRISDRVARHLGIVPFAIVAHLCVLLLLGVASVLLSGVGVRRVAYSALAYGGFVGMSLLPAVAIALGRARQLLGVIAIVAVCCAIGLLADYFLDLSGAMFLGVGGDPDVAPFAVGDIVFRRAMFPFDSPSTGYGFLSLGLLTCQLFFLYPSRPWQRPFALAGIAIIFLGGVATLTRAIWLLQACWVVLLAAQVLRRGDPRHVLMLTALSVVSLGGIVAFLGSSEHGALFVDRIYNAFSSSDEGNDIRLQLWSQGLAMIARPDDTLVLGHGIGLTVESFSDGGPVVTHFESSFFQAYYEGGLVGLFLRYWPYCVAAAALVSGVTRERAPIAALLGCWLLGYLASTTIAPTAGAYSGQLALFTVLGASVALPALCRALVRERARLAASAER